MIRRFLGLILAVSLVGCSAIGLGEQQAQATQQTEDVIARTVESRVNQNQAEVTETLAIMFEQATSEADTLATQIAQVTVEHDELATQMADMNATLAQAQTQIAELEPTTQPDSESTAEVTPDIVFDGIPTTAEITIFGTVPIDSDSLNSITGLAFDDEGHLLVSLRSGDIYRLEDTDDDGEADETNIIFEDTENDIRQVSGIFVQAGVIHVLNGNQLSQLQDSDDDGIYDTVVQLSDELPANQALLQANNSIIRSPDGRYFTADVDTGDILQVILQE